MRIFLLLLLLSCLYCGPKQQISRDFIPMSPPEVTFDEDPMVEELINATMSLFEEGRSLMDEGEFDEAIALMDEATFQLMTCNPALGDQLAMIDYGEHLLSLIHDAEIEAASRRESLITAELDELLAQVNDLEADLATETEPLEVGYDMPIVRNKIVERFIEIFHKDRGHVIGASLERSTRYLPMMRQIFKEEGVPLELCYLPLIESGYRTRARSKAKAVGLWQFIRSTGHLYQLRSSWWHDDRMNPELSTRAAARHLRDLYEQYGDWNLVLSAYNAGPGRVNRAIKRGRTRNFWTMYNRRLLPRETRGYVPAFMAAVIIAKDPDTYGFSNLEYQPPLDQVTLTVDFGVDLDVIAERLGIEPDILRDANPQLIRGITPSSKKTKIKVPRVYGEAVAKLLREIPETERLQLVHYRLKPGDTLSKLATQYGISVRALMDANNIRNPRTLKIGQDIMVPTGPELKGRVRTASKEERLEVKEIKYKVKRGDTLFLLSKRYQTNIPSLLARNPEINPMALLPEQELIIRQGDRWETKRPTRSKGYTLYRVKKGDSVSTIAKHFGLETSQLMKFNRLSRNSIIRPNQQLKIPNKQDKVLVYKVKRGDTLYSIARNFRTSVNKIMEWNNLRSKNVISLGQSLVIYR